MQFEKIFCAVRLSYVEITGGTDMRASLRAMLLGACLTAISVGGTTLASAEPAAASAARAPVVAVTKHTGTFNGQKVAYKAIVAETILTDAAATPSRT